MSSYEESYRIYRQVVRYVMSLNQERSVAESLADQALRGVDDIQLSIHARSHGFGDALDEILHELNLLRATGNIISGGRHEDDPLPDVYAAALSMRIGGDWKYDPERSVYRGQRRSDWQVIPSLYRPNPDGTPANIPERQKRLSALVEALKQQRPDLSDIQCVAVAQHYSTESGTKTHLIDVTLEPLVALFFASLNGRSGDIGVVDHIIVPEWQRLVAKDFGDPGAIRTIEVPGIERIARQRALFLDLPNPEIYERYGPYRIWFRQRTKNSTFEDAAEDDPITVEGLYTSDAVIERALASFDPDSSDPHTFSVSLPLEIQSPTGDRLFDTASNLDPRVAHLSSHNQTVLRVVSQVLARSSEWVQDDNRVKYSLHRLGECIDVVAGRNEQGVNCRLEDAFMFMRSRLDEEEEEALWRLARSYWLQTYCVPPDIVLEEVTRLIHDIKGLRQATAGVAFCGTEGHVEVVLNRMHETSAWKFLDLRHSTDAQIVSQLSMYQNKDVIVAACGQVEPLSWVWRSIVKARLNKFEKVDLHPHGEISLSGNNVLILVFGGDQAFVNRTKTVNLIPYWLDIDDESGRRR